MIEPEIVLLGPVVVILSLLFLYLVIGVIARVWTHHRFKVMERESDEEDRLTCEAAPYLLYVVENAEERSLE